MGLNLAPGPPGHCWLGSVQCTPRRVAGGGRALGGLDVSV